MNDERLLVSWYSPKIYRLFTRWPKRWTYRKPLTNPRVILLRGCGTPIGEVHRELDDDGRVWYRIEGSSVRFELLGDAANALTCRHLLAAVEEA